MSFSCNVMDLQAAKWNVENCYKRTNKINYKNVLIMLEKIIKAEKEKPCRTCIYRKKCEFRERKNNE
jgi:hypothetical protein